MPRAWTEAWDQAMRDAVHRGTLSTTARAHRKEAVPIVSIGSAGGEGAGQWKYVQVATATATQEEARQIARVAVERRLAACAQVLGPVASTYWWQGGIETAGEWLCLLKTPASEFESLAHHIRAEHSYDTPEITATPITRGSADYLAWIERETVGGGMT